MYSIAMKLDLKKLRAAAGLSQYKLAAHLKLPQSAVSRLERQDDWKLSTLVAYVKALGGRITVTVEDTAIELTEQEDQD